MPRPGRPQLTQATRSALFVLWAKRSQRASSSAWPDTAGLRLSARSAWIPPLANPPSRRSANGAEILRHIRRFVPRSARAALGRRGPARRRGSEPAPAHRRPRSSTWRRMPWHGSSSGGAAGALPARYLFCPADGRDRHGAVADARTGAPPLGHRPARRGPARARRAATPASYSTLKLEAGPKGRLLVVLPQEEARNG